MISIVKIWTEYINLFFRNFITSTVVLQFNSCNRSFPLKRDKEFFTRLFNIRVRKVQLETALVVAPILDRDEIQKLKKIIFQKINEKEKITYARLLMSKVVFKDDDGNPYNLTRIYF